MKDFESKYKELKIIGEGTFGRVYKGTDEHNNPVAIKQIKFIEGTQGIPSTALREMTALKTLSGHPNIIQMKDKIYVPKEKKLKIIFDFYDYDLKKYINAKEHLGEHLIRKIMKQILNGVAFCHSKKILHRDLKPQNILIDAEGNLRIADFGLARVLLLPFKTLTQQVQTLWYRAPQVLLGNNKYDFSMDIWAVGCIFAQLYLNKPLFYGNGHQIQQIFKIFEIMGTPSIEYWQSLKGLENFKKTFPKWAKKPLNKEIINMPKPAINLLEKMLEMNPEKRISAIHALEHGYFQDAEA